MSILLIQGCSKSKNRPTENVPAMELYSGFFFKIIKKAMRDGAFDDRIDVCILSAKHGLIDSDTEIGWYDRRMDAERAAELKPTVTQELQRRVAGSYETVIVNVGHIYRQALGDVSALDADVQYIEGGGIGAKGHLLKRCIRGELEAVDEQAVPTAT